MKAKESRLNAIKKLISSGQVSSQDDVMKELQRMGFSLTQATLSRDMKQLKVAKASTIEGKYVYVLPNDKLYRRITNKTEMSEGLRSSGFVSIHFSGNICVIHTKPGYASPIAYDVDMRQIPEVLGTIAGDDTIFVALQEGVTHEQAMQALAIFTEVK